ncbi:hypothetical protein [Streptomyces canus]|uniref:hypothetical protein n=1 Tax=Streptomyces canus TaxID=58343 RepID=UPI003868F820|nr:hypothetical protein OH824_34750 [Streptomyces canus]
MSVATNLLPANTSSIDTDTSGWSTGSNTTLTRNTSRAYSGTTSLQLTATAAGSVSASTSARVPVTAGNTYTAYAYFANLAAASGRQVNVFIGWFSSVTGGTAISYSTSANATLPNSTAFATPPPVVVATAPAGATYAVIGINGLSLTAGASVLADAIAFGPPALISGNLLPYSVQSVEVDATGWQGIWQATVGVSSTQSFEGWRSLSITSTATGNCRATHADAMPVTAGVEYMSYVWVYAPASTSDWYTSVRWYDAAGNILSTSVQQWGVSPAAWTRIAVIGTAPPGAVTARLVLEPVATAIGQTWLCDQMALLPAPVVPGSLLGYAARGMETGSTAWVAAGGCTKARSEAVAYEGIASLKIVCDGTSDAVVQLASSVPVTPRQAYRFTPHLYHSGRTTPPLLDLVLYWYNAAGILVGTNFNRYYLATTAGWFAPVGSAVAPDAAVGLRIGVRFLGPAAGDTYYADSMSVAPGGLGAVADLIGGSYGARVSIQGLTTDGMTKWGIWRMLDDGTISPLRGPDGDLTAATITGDLAIVEDYEASLGVPCRYFVKVWTTPSYYRASTSEPITLPEPPDTAVVIKDPGLPARWAEAIVSKGGMPDWTRSARQGVNAVRGRARPIVISDVRTSRAGTMTLVTETQDELDSMWWLLETGNTLLLQWPSEWGERDVYVQVGDVTEAHVAEYAAYRDRTWSVPLTEVDRPVGGITGSTDRTWQDVLDDRSDWLDVMANANSWLDVYTGIQGG